MTMKTPDERWRAAMVGVARVKAAKRWGAGWHLLTDDQRHAEVCRFVLSTIAEQDLDGAAAKGDASRLLGQLVALASHALKDGPPT